MPNLMVALPNVCGAHCSTPQSLADAHYQMPCSNAAKTQNPLKFIGVPQTPEPISAVSRPTFTILSGHVSLEEVLMLNNFFSDCRYMPYLRRYGPTKLCDGDEMAILRPVFAASRVQRISDVHSKFTLRPHHVPKYGKHPISDR